MLKLYEKLFGTKPEENDMFTDVRISTDKVLHTVSMGEFGYTSALEDRTKNDDGILVSVEFDGAGYDYLCMGGPLSEKISEKLEKIGCYIEYSSSWCFVVVDGE